MYNSGDAAEQIVRISLEGTEVALKLTGSAAKNIAAMIYAVLKNRDKNKTKGRQRLTAMLKSGKELKVFTVGEEHLKQFATEAKRYGVVYCALRGKEKSADGMVDIMVRAEDASKINRIVERFKLAAVDIGDTHLPIVITEGYGKRYVAFCNRFKQGVDRFCNGVLKFFPFSLVRHSISFDLVAGIHNKIRFFVFNCRIEQSHSVRRYFRYLLHIGNLHNFK